jgi:glycosyltransferase involved in cell wall biosynthesis
MLKETPTISVLIPTYNRTEYLAECLDSIIAQTLPATQIIVVNDGASEHTRHALEPYMKKIDYWENDKLFSTSKAINHGLQRVTGQYLWIFDDDDVALPDALERLVDPLERQPELNFSFSTFYFTANQKGSNKIGNVLWETKIPDLDTRGPLIPLLEDNFLGGAALFTRSSVYSQVGNFLPDLLRAQDYEMAIRITRQFTGIRVAGGATFYYRQHNGLRGAINERFKPSENNKYWLKYDQIIFRRLYHDLPLAEYLPPGIKLEENRRKALLQRMSIMAAKLLHGKVIRDLQELSLLNDKSTFSVQERMLIRNMMKVPFYGTGSLFYSVEFFDELRRLSDSSMLIHALRHEIMRVANEMLRVGNKI